MSCAHVWVKTFSRMFDRGTENITEIFYKCQKYGETMKEEFD
jgi:uncharacterized protein YaaN involved in tellurite resistance